LGQEVCALNQGIDDLNLLHIWARYQDGTIIAYAKDYTGCSTLAIEVAANQFKFVHDRVF
jgi:hypothetical protein